MAAEFTDTDRVAFIREMVVRYGFLPREVSNVMMDNRATNAEFDRALQTAMEKHGCKPTDGVPGLTDQLARSVDAIEANHDPLCMAVLRGKECTCGVLGRQTTEEKKHG